MSEEKRMTAKIISFDIMTSQREIDERIQRCDEQAGWYFAQATKAQKAEFDATMKSLLGVTGPKWDRAREAARAKFRESTAEARLLCDLTFDELMQAGEVGPELDALWTELIDREAVRVAMQAAE